MLHQLRLIVEALPWTVPAFLGGGALALITMLLFPKRRSRSDRLGFALVVWCLALALVVTLSPVKNSYFGIPSSGCNLDVWRPLSYRYWLSAGSRPPNIWLLLPAGLGAMMLDGFWRRFLTVGFFVALPPGIEALQDLYPELKRSCSSQDIVDNWTGLFIGFALGIVLMLFVGLARLARRRKERARRAGVDQDEWTGAGAHPVDDRNLPLGGGRTGGYSDFEDFDDSPNSTRWWTQSDPDETHALPQRDSYSLDSPTDDSRTPEYGVPERGREEEAGRRAGDVDATQVMPTRGTGRRHDGPDSDDTQIIPRG